MSTKQTSQDTFRTPGHENTWTRSQLKEPNTASVSAREGCLPEECEHMGVFQGMSFATSGRNAQTPFLSLWVLAQNWVLHFTLSLPNKKPNTPPWTWSNSTSEHCSLRSIRELVREILGPKRSTYSQSKHLAIGTQKPVKVQHTDPSSMVSRGHLLSTVVDPHQCRIPHLRHPALS